MTSNARKRTCFSIGYGNEPIDRFIAVLHGCGIDTLVDVRSVPFSRWRPDFNKENLKKILADKRIKYIWMGDRLGGRYTDPALLNPDGSVNYRKVQETEKFREGITGLLALIGSGKVVALICAERDPERCHRFLLVAPALMAAGARVVHVLGDGTLKDHGELAGSWSGNRQVDLSGEPVV